MFELESPPAEFESTESPSAEAPATDAAPPAAPEITDIGSLEKFKFEGREWTPQELRNAYLMERDYRQKTQQLSEEKKYSSNLYYDLQSVRNDPSLANQFRSTYPSQYHHHLDSIIGKSQSVAKPQAPSQAYNVDPALVQRFNQMEKRFLDQEVKAINAELDVKFEKFSKQYPYADEEAVVARAEHIVKQGGEMTDKIWNDIWKSSSERNQKIAEARYAEQIKSQKTINKQSKDVPTGGGIAAPAQKMPRTIKEASVLALQELDGL